MVISKIQNSKISNKRGLKQPLPRGLSQPSVLHIKLQTNNDYMLIIDKNYVVNTIKSQHIEIPQDKMTNIDAIIEAGYCVFNSNGEVINSQISMINYYNTDENTVRKIAYVLHHSENRQYPKNPVAIQSSSNSTINKVTGGFQIF